MRIREEDSRTNVILRKTVSGSSSGVTSYSKENYSGTYHRTADVVIPRFHERSKKGELFFNPYQTIVDTRFQNGGDCGYTKIQAGTDYYADYSGGALWYFGANPARLLHHIEGHRIGETLRREAFTRAKANANKPIFQGATEVGELRETLRFVKSPLKSLNAFFRKNRKGIQKQREWEKQVLLRTRGLGLKKSRSSYYFDDPIMRSTFQVLGDSVLAGRYAVRPLIGSVVSAMSAVDQAVHNVLGYRETSRGFSAQSKTLSKDEGMIASVGYFDLHSELTTDINTSVRAGVMYRLLEKNVWGFHYPDYPSAAYELLWLSFIADWFANTGAYLQALVPRSSLKVLGEWTTTEFEITTRRSVTATWSNPGSSYTGHGNPGGSEMFRSKGKTRRIGDQSGWTLYHDLNLGADQVLDLILIGKNLIKG